MSNPTTTAQRKNNSETAIGRYEIGGLCVSMTRGAARRWNVGQPTSRDLRCSLVGIPLPDLGCRRITLRRAMNARLEPEAAAQICGAPANPIE